MWAHGEIAVDCQLLVYKGSTPFEEFRQGKTKYGEFYNVMKSYSKSSHSLELDAVLSTLEKPAEPIVAVAKAAPPAPTAPPKIDVAQWMERIQQHIAVFEKAREMKDAKGAVEKIQTALAKMDAVSKKLDMTKDAQTRYEVLRSAMKSRLEAMREKLRADEIAKAAKPPEGITVPAPQKAEPSKQIVLASRGIEMEREEAPSKGIKQAPALVAPSPVPSVSVPAPTPKPVSTPAPVAPTHGKVDADMLAEKIMESMEAYSKAEATPDARKAMEEIKAALDKLEASAKGLDMTPEALDGYESMRNIMKEKLDALRKQLTGKPLPPAPKVPITGPRSQLPGGPGAMRTVFEASL